VIPDVLAPGQQHLDSGLLKGKIQVGKVNLPVVQIFFLFIKVVYYKATANVKSNKYDGKV
jgi:hypothetical protein